MNYATALRGPTGAPLVGEPSSISTTPVPISALTSATGANAVPVQIPVIQPTVPENTVNPALNPIINSTMMTGMVAGTTNANNVRIPPVTGPSPVLLLCNMVDPDEANNELKEEVRLRGFTFS